MNQEQVLCICVAISIPRMIDVQSSMFIHGFRVLIYGSIIHY